MERNDLKASSTIQLKRSWNFGTPTSENVISAITPVISLLSSTMLLVRITSTGTKTITPVTTSFLSMLWGTTFLSTTKTWQLLITPSKRAAWSRCGSKVQFLMCVLMANSLSTRDTLADRWLFRWISSWETRKGRVAELRLSTSTWKELKA